MKILAIDTSGQTASTALIEDEKLIGEFTQNDKLTHSQTILPMVAEICEKTNTDPKDVDYIACAVGPGSFTGLRIGACNGKRSLSGTEQAPSCRSNFGCSGISYVYDGRYRLPHYGRQAAAGLCLLL